MITEGMLIKEVFKEFMKELEAGKVKEGQVPHKLKHDFETEDGTEYQVWYMTDYYDHTKIHVAMRRPSGRVLSTTLTRADNPFAFIFRRGPYLAYRNLMKDYAEGKFKKDKSSDKEPDSEGSAKSNV